MKYLLAVLAAITCCAAAAAQPAQSVGDLRRVVQQYHPASAPHPQADTRQLTADERAQLRRQLADFKHPPPPISSSEGPTTR